MGIDINSMDDKWKKAAQIADNADRDKDEALKGNKQLDLDCIFEKRAFVAAAKEEKIPENDIQSFLAGQGIKEPIGEILQIKSALKDDKKPVVGTWSKDDKYAAEDLMFRAILSEGANFYDVNKVNWTELAKNIKPKNENLNVNQTGIEYYDKLESIIKEVAQAIDKKSYNSRTDVSKLYKDVLKDDVFKKKDNFKDYRKTILKAFVMLAEQHQKAKEEQKLNDAYKEMTVRYPQEYAIGKTLERFASKFEGLAEKYRNWELSEEDALNIIKTDKEASAHYNKLTKKYTRTEAVKELKEKFSGSYYDGYNKLDYSDRFYNTRKYGHSGLISQFENSIVMSDGEDELFDAYDAQMLDPKNPDKNAPTKSRIIQKNAKEMVTRDKYTNKALRGRMSFSDRSTFEMSKEKRYRKAVAAYNRVELNKLKPWTRQDFYEAVDDGTAMMQLINTKLQKLIKYDPKTDTYNITALAELIQDTICPYDMRGNYQKRILEDYCEIDKVAARINEEAGVKISYDDACNLIDMCGFDRDKKNVGYYLKAIEKAASDTIKDIPKTAITALTVGVVAGNVTVGQAITNFGDVIKSLMGMNRGFDRDPDNAVELNLRFKINVNVNGEKVDYNSSVNRLEVLRQLKKSGLPQGTYGFEQGDDGSWYLWIKKPSDDPYKEAISVADILGENFDIDSLGFEAKSGEAKQDDPEVDRLQGFIWGTVTSFAVNAIAAALSEMEGEDSVIPIVVTAKTHEAYKRSLETNDKITPKVKAALGNMALVFAEHDKEGNLIKDEFGETKINSLKFAEFLQGMGGRGSFINKTELLRACRHWLREHPDNGTLRYRPNKPEEQPKVIPDFAPKVPEKQPCNPTVISKSQPHIIKAGDSWDLILDSYYPGMPKDKRTLAKRALKRANGIKLSDTNLKGKLELPPVLFGIQRNPNMNQEEYDKINAARRKKNWNSRAWHDGEAVGGLGKGKAYKVVDDCSGNTPRTIYEGEEDYNKYN